MPRPSEVKDHWRRLALEHGTGLTATTMTPTIKRLEVAALLRALRRLESLERVLEVGCGNGANLLPLAKALPRTRFTGVDYVPEMVEAARRASTEIRFLEGDVLRLGEPDLEDAYDAVFADRCLINLSGPAEQLAGLENLAEKTRSGGLVILIENTLEAYQRQNDLRESLGLPRRTPPFHNVLIEEKHLLGGAEALGLDLISTEEFAGLHDLLLYVLVPSVNGGVIDYDNPLVEAATNLLLTKPDAAGVSGAGQNRLFLFHKP